MKSSISLSKFLVRFYGVRSQEILNLTHKDVEVLFPHIKRSSFDHIAQHSEDVASGKVIMVTDCKGNTIPYYAKQVIEDLDDAVIECYKRKEEKIDFNIDLQELTNWELIQFLRKCKKKIAVARTVYKEMAKRGMRDRKKENIKRMVYYEY